MIKSFKDLEVYKESYDLALIIYKVSLEFPAFEKNDLGSQMRRASKSIPANIAEGWAKRQCEKEFKKHLQTALGSSNEMEVHINFAKDFKYLSSQICNDLSNRYILLGGKLVSLRNKWKTF